MLSPTNWKILPLWIWGKGSKRDRVLTADEVRDVWYWANTEENNSKLSPVNRVTLVIMMVFGCRGRELRESLWNEWDFKEWIWTVPKEHSKNGREIIRPIPRKSVNGL